MIESKGLNAVGNMDVAFFVSRKELIDWINRCLKLNITKIEQCSNGAIYIQLLDILFPNKSVLHKAKWNAKLEYECIINYKLIQNVFNKLGIKKYMDVDKLIKGKYQDNLEFLQWFKAFYERIIDYNNEQIINYDAIERRKMCILGEKGDYKLLNSYLPEWAKVDLNIIKEKNIYNENRMLNNTQKKKIDSRCSVNQENNKNNSNSYNNKKDVKGEKRNILLNIENENNLNSMTYREEYVPKKQNTINNDNLNKRLSVPNKFSSQGSLSSYYTKCNNSDLQKDNISLIEQNKKLKLQLENMNQEIYILQNKLQEEENEKKILLFQKNFYYNKLRFLELLCNQTNESFLSINDIQQIIYARENTYFHQTISLKDKNNNDDNETLSVNNNHDLTLQNSINNSETFKYNNQNSTDFATYCT
ncbi:EB1 homolog, putative [Plasmodium gallinaceum]|uniref:EB1 homolog, putative n=1 Tax=Plasmodium gallinaceum TaxID=5849 RepID=A0A1J1GS93_PLAGA|nr:EB1 homolog, putative [Plasmodium gallinaceum]CRG95300.1 EB1 homolog, putative [Plasmodium gallinaceum]